MNVQEFYDYIKKYNKTDAEMRIVLNPDNPFAKGVVVTPYMIDIRHNIDKDGNGFEYEVIIG